MTYPATLPTPQLNGFEYVTNANGIRSDFSYAQKQVFTHNENAIINFKITLRHDELLIFKSFYDTDLLSGMAVFEADWNIENNTNTKKMRFVTPYGVKNIGGLMYEVEAQIEVLTKGGF